MANAASRRWPAAEVPATLTAESVRALGDVLGLLARLVSRGGRRASEREPAAFKKAALRLMGVAAERASDLDSLFDLLGESEVLVSEGLVERDAVRAAVARATECHLAELESLADRLLIGARTGRLSAVTTIAGHYPAGRALRAVLERTLRERSSAFPPESQRWLTSYLGVQERPRVIQAEPAEAPDIRQAAGLLLFLSESADPSPAFREAAERFTALCEAHFHLRLRERRGTVVSYNPQLHELAAGEPTESVMVTRPGVELIDPPRSLMVLRAAVEPARMGEQP